MNSLCAVLLGLFATTSPAPPSYPVARAPPPLAAASGRHTEGAADSKQVVVPWSSAALITAARDSSGGGRATVLDADDGQPKQRFTRLWTLQECVLPSKLFFLVPAGTKTQAEGTATVTTRLVTTSNGSTAALQRERRIGDRQRPTPGRSFRRRPALLPLTVRKASVRTALLLSSVRECRYPVDRLHGILGLLPAGSPGRLRRGQATATTSANTLSWFGGFQPGLFVAGGTPVSSAPTASTRSFFLRTTSPRQTTPRSASTPRVVPASPASTSTRSSPPTGVLLRQVPVVQVSTIDCGEPAFFTKDNVFYSESATRRRSNRNPTSPKQTIFSRARAALTTAAQHAAALTEAAALRRPFADTRPAAMIAYPQPLCHASAARIREAVDAARQIVLVLAGSAVGNDVDDPLHAFGAALADVYAV
ncbi:hypothetical protein DFJ73DRAFT_929291 [Zopfochytrium polystomum]|nr:hypothetical protein DFJ73DRAFT_929291 [Zopfochytrium polystomum]